jgi:hypothetical protein
VSELSFRWQHCNVSQEPLKKPIVACTLGRLYNKDTIIEKLLDKSSIPETMAHIKGLKVRMEIPINFPLERIVY